MTRFVARASTLAALMLALGVSRAYASPIVLTFAGLQNDELIGSFYNGGVGGSGSGPGPSFGITFGAGAVAFISQLDGGTGTFDFPLSDSALSGATSSYDMDVPAGFTTGFSFFYAADEAKSVSIFSGLDGGGTLLATIPLPVNNTASGGCGGSALTFFDCWAPVGATFAGTAESVVFNTDGAVGLANVTVGSATPAGAVPEPGSLVLLGTGLAAIARGLKRKRAS